MNCVICGKSREEAILLEGIYGGEITKVCSSCAELENIPLIKKPTQEQLQRAEERHSVRQRMENLSELNKGYVSKEHSVALKNLAKIKIPKEKQYPEELVHNYSWELQMARRRQKLSVNQLAQKTGMSVEEIDDIEKGQLPEKFEVPIRILEEALEIKVFKEPFQKLIFHLPEKKPEQREKEIMEYTREKMQSLEEAKDEEQSVKKPGKREKLMREISSGHFDFSKKENIQNITLSDLVELKKQREKRKRFKEEKEEHKEMFGDDVEIEETDKMNDENLD